jgi:nuclear pore complex protein Nup53
VRKLEREKQKKTISKILNFLKIFPANSTTTNFNNSPDFGRTNLQQRYLQQSPNSSFPSNLSINTQPNISQQVFQNQNPANNITGPPINSLFDTYGTLRSEKNLHAPTKSFQQQENIQLNQSGFNQSRIMSPIPNMMTDFNSSYQSNSLFANNNYSNNKMTNEFWVTVFGFTIASTSIVLAHFNSIGTILEKVCSSGNWMHIRFSTKNECDKALLFNGKIIGNNLMIGVIPCQDESIIEKENVGEYQQQSISKIRNLTHSAYQLAKNDTEVVHASSEIKKSSGLVNKAMDMLFNW